MGSYGLQPRGGHADLFTKEIKSLKVITAICIGLDKFFRCFYYLSGVVLMALLGLSGFIVFARLFHISPIWSDELQRFLMLAMVFVSIPYMASSKSFLIVDLTAIFFGRRKKLHNATIFIGEFILLGILICLFFPCLELAVKNAKTFSPAMRLPMIYMYGFMPASFALAALAIVKNLLKRSLVERRGSEAGEVK